MKTAYITKRFNAKLKQILDAILNVFDSYPNDKMTVRQVFYQLVSQGSIPNTQNNYHQICRIIRDGRMAGYIDFDAIEDRVRSPDVPQYFENLDSLVDTAITSYKLDRWADQPYYIEVWLEKDALSGIFSRYTSEYNVVLQVDRGYNSLSAMYEGAQRFIENKDKKCHLLYFGDFDPSGEDMTNDIPKRLSLLKAGHVQFHKLAILKADIDKYKLPPNPLKISDPRSNGFRATHGEEAVELDALPIDVLKQRIETSIRSYIDFDKRQAVIDSELEGKEKLTEKWK